MRNLLSGAIAGIALATLFVGAASAANMPNDQSSSTNIATQDEMQRDNAQNPLRRSPLGELVTPSNSTATVDRMEQGAYVDGSKAWLDRSPLGEPVQQAAGVPNGNSAHD